MHQRSYAGHMQPTLVINVPRTKVNSATGWDSFDSVVRSGVAPDCIILESDMAKLSAKFKVVLLDKTDEKRVEADGVRLDPTTKAGNNQQRYNVYFDNPVRVNYKPEPVNRNGGTAVI